MMLPTQTNGYHFLLHKTRTTDNYNNFELNGKIKQGQFQWDEKS